MEEGTCSGRSNFGRWPPRESERPATKIGLKTQGTTIQKQRTNVLGTPSASFPIRPRVCIPFRHKLHVFIYGASPSAAGPLDCLVDKWLSGLVVWWLSGSGEPQIVFWKVEGWGGGFQ